MDTDELRRALARHSAQLAPDLTERVLDALTDRPGANGLPDLDFLPARLQVTVLAAQYGAFIDDLAARYRGACAA